MWMPGALIGGLLTYQMYDEAWAIGAVIGALAGLAVGRMLAKPPGNRRVDELESRFTELAARLDWIDRRLAPLAVALFPSAPMRRPVSPASSSTSSKGAIGPSSTCARATASRRVTRSSSGISQMRAAHLRDTRRASGHAPAGRRACAVDNGPMAPCSMWSSTRRHRRRTCGSETAPPPAAPVAGDQSRRAASSVNRFSSSSTRRLPGGFASIHRREARERTDDGADGPCLVVHLVGQQPTNERSRVSTWGSSGWRDVDIAGFQNAPAPRGTEDYCAQR